jgi:hypothetical protein
MEFARKRNNKNILMRAETWIFFSLRVVVGRRRRIKIGKKGKGTFCFGKYRDGMGRDIYGINGRTWDVIVKEEEEEEERDVNESNQL